jgi:hypothetical protein
MSGSQNMDAVKLNSRELYETLKLFIDHNKNLLVTGAPGVGKTEIIKQACRDRGAECIVFHPVISDPTDFKGMPCIINVTHEDSNGIVKHEAKFVPFNHLKTLINTDKRTIAFGDDLGQAAAMVQAAWMQLVLGGQLDDKVISPNVSFISATNRKQDKAGVQGILEPLKSRFVSIVELTVDADVWLDDYARKPENKIHPFVRAFIRWRPKNLWDFQPSNDMSNTPSPRTVKHVSDIMHMNPPGSLRGALVAGAAGAGFATEFGAFIKVIKELPKMSAIIQMPDRCPVPSDVSAQYAIVEAMLDKIAVKWAKPMFEYISRFPKEFQGWFYNQIKDTHNEVIKTKAVTEWAVRHGIS